MKKFAVLLATGALVLGVGAVPSQAVSIKACNKGTFTAAHVNGVASPGIYKIGAVCHG